MSASNTEKMTSRRLNQPQSVQEAKAAAERLQGFLKSKNMNLSRSLSLEAISHASGFRDWNTFHAMLVNTSNPSADTISVEISKIDRAMHFIPGEANKCIEMLSNLCGLRRESGGDMWEIRRLNLLECGARLHFALCETKGLAPSITDLREIFSLNNFCQSFNEILKIDGGTGYNDIHAFLQTIPGLTMEQVHSVGPFDLKTLEQWGFMSIIITKKIGDLVDS